MKDIVGIYCRLSEEDRDKRRKEDESESIQNQKSMLVTYACQKGWEIYAIYCDEDYAGSDRNRPQFNQMLRDAEAGKINIILCKTQSRFSREMEIIEKYIHGYFVLWGTRFVSLVDNADTQNRGNKKARQINGLINEWFLEDMSDSIKSVLNDKRSKGLHIGSSVAYGYKKDPERKGHIMIDEPAAAVVREIFELFISGVGKTEITRILNRRKIPNPSLYKYENGLYGRKELGKCGGLWGYAVVSRILSNEIYIGNLIQGKTGTVSYKIQKKYRKPEEEWFYCRGTHEPIIAPEIWEKAQALIKERSTPCRNGMVSIYARKVRCAYCGYIMHSLKTGGRRYLRCTSVTRMPGVCTGAFISEKALGNHILEEFHKLQKAYLDEEAAQEMIRLPSRQENQKKQINHEIAELIKKENKCKTALKELYMDKAAGSISLEDFQDFSKGFHSEIEGYERMVQEKKEILAVMETSAARNLTKKDIFEKYSDIHELNYDIMNTFIDHIEVGHRKTLHEEYPIRIFWKF